MRWLIRRLDALARRACGVFVFCEDRECLLRLQVRGAPHTLHFPVEVVRAGEPVLMLHLWNEHIPPMPPAGPDLAWATRALRLLIHSLRAVSREMRKDPRLAGVRAVGGVTAVISPSEASGGAQLMKRLGFTVIPYHRPLGRFGEFWENFFSWGLMWTFNRPSWRRRKLFDLRRTEVWMSREDSVDRF